MTVSNQYWAGFFDGEGSVSITNVLRPRVTLSQNDRIILDEAENQFGGSVVGKGDGRCYNWIICRAENIEKFFEAVYPFLIVKKKQVEIVWELVRLIRKDNRGFNPLQKVELANRLDLRMKLQELRPNKQFRNIPSSEMVKRLKIKESQNYQCFDCSKNLSDDEFNALVNKDGHLRCRKCSALMFAPNKKPRFPLTKEQIENASKGNTVDKACEILKISRATYYYKKKRFDVNN